MQQFCVKKKHLITFKGANEAFLKKQSLWDTLVQIQYHVPLSQLFQSTNHC